MVARIADEASDDSVAVQSRPEIIGTDEEILAFLFLRKHMARPAGMNLKRPGKKIRSLREDVVITSDADDPTAPFKILQTAVHF
jgi:hypothetical protein